MPTQRPATQSDKSEPWEPADLTGPSLRTKRANVHATIIRQLGITFGEVEMDVFATMISRDCKPQTRAEQQVKDAFFEELGAAHRLEDNDEYR